MSKIKSLSISSFRGIPNACELNFCEKEVPRSAIIYGGNGSGKSSIVDALEFVLQGRIGRSPSIKNPLRPSVFNLLKTDLISPIVTASFDDNTISKRTINIEKEEHDGEIITRTSTEPKEICESFNRVPIALRRNDITAFNNTKETERQLLISQFVYQDSPVPKLEDDPVILDLQDNLLKAKQSKRKHLRELCEILQVNYDEAEEESSSGVLDYCNSKIAHNPRMGVSRKGKQRRIVSYEVYAKAKFHAIKCDESKDKIKEIQSKINKQTKKLISGTKNPITSKINVFLQKSSQYLTDSFKKLSNADYVKDIRLSVGNKTQVSFNIDVKLKNGIIVSPTDVFSEANYDLMILLLYLAIIRVGVDFGQSPVLVLDDVLQSVDSNIRTNFIDYILRELPKWQIIITCHDRLWLEQLRYLFNLRSHAFKEFHIYNWSFDLGPLITESKGHTTDNTLKDAIATKNVRIIAAVSGPFLEMICNELSVSLRCSIKRVSMDKYTLGDLWPAVKKALNKTSLSTVAEEINRLLYIRNLLGCHFNQWADSLSDEEVIRFASAIQTLYESTYCSNCFSWVHPDPSGGKNPSCNCGILDLHPSI